VILAVKEQIARLFQNNHEEVPVPDIRMLSEKATLGEQLSAEKVKLAVCEAEKVVSGPWFKDIYSRDPELKKFYESYKALKA